MAPSPAAGRSRTGVWWPAVVTTLLVLIGADSIRTGHWVQGPLVLGLAAWRLFTLLARWRRLRRRERIEQGLCPACGYDLCESRTRCPECGRPVSRVILSRRKLHERRDS